VYTECMKSKSTVRANATKRRSAISPREHRLASLSICQNLFDDIDWSSMRRINTYHALKSLNEADPTSLLQRIMREYPHIEIVMSPFNIDAKHPKGSFDIVIAPVVAFDTSCNRIGMGGGWYDGYFAAHPTTKKIGLAFEVQKVSEVPISATDVPMDMIVTEKMVYRR